VKLGGTPAVVREAVALFFDESEEVMDGELTDLGPGWLEAK
jgi:hypothetical protein